MQIVKKWLIIIYDIDSIKNSNIFIDLCVIKAVNLIEIITATVDTILLVVSYVLPITFSRFLFD